MHVKVHVGGVKHVIYNKNLHHTPKNVAFFCPVRLKTLKASPFNSRMLRIIPEYTKHIASPLQESPFSLIAHSSRVHQHPQMADTGRLKATFVMKLSPQTQKATKNKRRFTEKHYLCTANHIVSEACESRSSTTTRTNTKSLRQLWNSQHSQQYRP